MSYVMVDIEADGPIPGDYSMVCFGAIIVEPSLSRTFYKKLKPISEKWDPAALKISGFSREETLGFDSPEAVMESFDKWLADNVKGRPIFISDNNGFDWQFINWYFHHFLGRNPFGFSSMNLGSLYKGLVKDTSKNFKHLRKTKHTHNPVDDAKGNAEAFLEMIGEMRGKRGTQYSMGELSMMSQWPQWPYIEIPRSRLRGGSLNGGISNRRIPPKKYVGG